MTLFEVLFVVHFVADWIFQSQTEANNKSKDWYILVKHCATYMIFFPIPIAFFGLRLVDIIWISIFLFSTHIILDKRTFEFWLLKQKGIFPVGRSSLRNFRGEDGNLISESLMWIIVIGVDQTLHILVLGIIAFLCGGIR